MSRKSLFNITDFQKDPEADMKNANGDSICVMNDDEPAFFCTPIKQYEREQDVLSMLKQLIAEGEESGDAQEWEPEKFIQEMKAIKDFGN